MIFKISYDSKFQTSIHCCKTILLFAEIQIILIFCTVYTLNVLYSGVITFNGCNQVQRYTCFACATHSTLHWQVGTIIFRKKPSPVPLKCWRGGCKLVRSSPAIYWNNTMRGRNRALNLQKKEKNISYSRACKNIVWKFAWKVLGVWKFSHFRERGKKHVRSL